MSVKTGNKSSTRKTKTASTIFRNNVEQASPGLKSSLQSSGVSIDIDAKPWIVDMQTKDVLRKWTCFITFMLETDVTFHGLLDLIYTKMVSGKRRAIKVISSETIQKMVLDHCFNTGERTPFSALCEQIKRTAGPRFLEKIPVELLAYMIKYIIYFERKHYLKEKQRKAKLKYRAAARYVSIALDYDFKMTFSTTSEEEEIFDDTVEGEEEEEEEEDEEEEVEEEQEVKIEEVKPDTSKSQKTMSKGKTTKNTPVEDETSDIEDSSELIEMLKGIEDILDKNVEEYKRRKMEMVLIEKLKNIPKKKLQFFLKYCQKRNRKESERKSTRQEEDIKKSKKSFEEGSSSKSSSESVSSESSESDDFAVIEERYKKRKMDTLLHKRGEPARDIYTFDDSPPNGPHMYIFITSLKDENLPEKLLALKVFIHAFLFIGTCMPQVVPRLSHVKIISCIGDLTEPYNEYMRKYGNYFSFLSAAAIERYANENYLEPSYVYNKLNDDITNFYKNFYKKITGIKTYKLYEDIIMTRYLPDISVLNLNSLKWIKTLANLLYEHVSKIVYYFYKVYLLYRKYQRKMKCKDLSIPFRLPKSRMRYYKTFLDRVPNEIITVPLILDAIIAQVCLNLKANMGYDLGNYTVRPKRHTQADKGNIIKETLKQLRKEYFPGLEKKVHIPIETKFIFCGDVLTLNSYRLGKWGKLLRNRARHILALYFENQWNRYVPYIDDLTEECNSKHFETLEKACKNMNIKFTKDILKILLNTMLLVEDNIIKTKSNSNQIKDVKKSFEDGKLSKCPSSVTIHSNYSELMKALITLKDQIKHGEDDIDEQLLSLTSSDESSCKVHKVIEQICAMDENKIKQLLNTIRHYENMPKRILIQTLWDAIQEYNSINVHYEPFTRSLIYVCCNESINVEEQGTIPARMSLREFYKTGLDELEDWCKEQEQFIKDHHLKGLFFTEMDKLKDKIIDPIKPVRITPRATLTQWHFTLPRRYREIIKARRKNPLCRLRNKNIKKVVRKKKPKVKPSLYYFGSLKRSKLFTNTREFCFNNSTIVSFKINIQMYHTPEITINIKRNRNNIIFHSELSKNNKEKSLLFTHSSGINIYFYEFIEDKFNWNLMTEECGERSEYTDISKEKEKQSNESCAEEYTEESESILSDEKHLEETLKDIFKTNHVNKVKHKELDKILEVKDPDAEVEAKFKCNFSYPSGLFVETVELENEDFTYVKQSYKIHSPGYEAINNEKSRLFLKNGTVIKIANKNLLPEILYPCGRWIKYSKFNYSNLIPKDEETEEENASKKESFDYRSDEEEILDEYHIFEPDGSYYKVDGIKTVLLEKKRYQECVDIFRDTKTVFMEDGQTFSYNGNNMLIITFNDGTKITTETDVDEEEVFCEWTKRELRQWFEGEWSLDEECLEEESKEKFKVGSSPSFYSRKAPPSPVNPSSAGTSWRKFGGHPKSSTSLKTMSISNRPSTDNTDDITDDSIDDRTYKTKPPDYYAYDYEEEEEEEEEVIGERKTVSEIMVECYGEYDYGHYFKKINLKNDGFLWIKTSYLVEHPYYATVSMSPYDDKIIFSLPHDIIIIKYDNGCIDLLADSCLSLSLRNDEIILDNFTEYELLQRSIIYYKVFENLSLESEAEVIFKSYDNDGNSVTADSTGNVQYSKVCKTIRIPAELDCLYNIETSVEPMKPSYLDDNTRRLIMDYNFTGLELLTNINIERFQKIFTNKCEQIKLFEEEPFLTYIYLKPFDHIKIANWKLDYSNMEKEPLFELPSTYGDSWQFPFRPKQIIKCKLPELMVTRFINTFKYDNIDEIFQDIIKEYLSILSNIAKKKIKGVQRKKNECFFPNIISISKTKAEAKVLHKKLWENCAVTFTLEKMELYKIRKKYESEKKVERIFRFKRKYSWLYFKRKVHDIHYKNYVPYFESGPGVAFHIIDLITDRVLMVIDILGLKDEIEQLLDKPMKELTEENLQHIKMYLELFYEQLPDKKGLNIDRILHAAVKLADYFPNVRHALQLRVNYKGEYTVEEYCERLKYEAEKQNETLKAAKKESIKKEERFLQQTIDKYLGDNCTCQK